MEIMKHKVRQISGSREVAGYGQKRGDIVERPSSPAAMERSGIAVRCSALLYVVLLLLSEISFFLMLNLITYLLDSLLYKLSML